MVPCAKSYRNLKDHKFQWPEKGLNYKPLAWNSSFLFHCAAKQNRQRIYEYSTLYHWRGYSILRTSTLSQSSTLIVSFSTFIKNFRFQPIQRNKFDYFKRDNTCIHKIRNSKLFWPLELGSLVTHDHNECTTKVGNWRFSDEGLKVYQWDWEVIWLRIVSEFRFWY